MDVFEAVDSRIACRWFLDKPIDPNMVRNLIAGAARAASFSLSKWTSFDIRCRTTRESEKQMSNPILHSGTYIC